MLFQEVRKIIPKMATLGDPWTVIGDGAGDAFGRPPLATWHDQSNGSFIGLLDESTSRSSDRADSESPAVATFQTYSLPAINNGANAAAPAPGMLPSNELIQRKEAILLELPADLLRKDQGNRNTESTADAPGQDGEEESPIMLAKLSLDQMYIAMQFSSTIVRITKIGARSVRCAERPLETTPHSASDADSAAAATSKYQKQWTIDLSGTSGEQPMVSDPGTMPKLDLFAGGAGAVARAAGFHARNLLMSRRGSSSGGEGGATVASTGDTIVPGGIFWVDRPLDGHPILVLVTSRAVRLYKISSPTKHSMRLLESFSVPTAIDCFWYEHHARCLMVGSLCRLFEDGENVEIFNMRAFSFRNDDQSRGNNASVTTVFEPFTVGKQLDGSVPFNSIVLAFLYECVFCVALGETSTTFIKLDSFNGRVTQMKEVPHPKPTDSLPPLDVTRAIVAVVDHTVIITDRDSDACLLLDVYGTSGSFCAYISADGLGDQSMAFLPPSSLLDSRGRGHLYGISLDLKLVVKFLPPTAAVVSFLLRRRVDPSLSHSLALEIINHAFSDKSKCSTSLLLTFLDLLACDDHGDNNAVGNWDNFACLPLVNQAALLSSDIMMTVPALTDEGLETTNVMFPFLTQTELLCHVLIPQAREAIAQRDTPQLNLLCEFCFLYMQTLEQHKLLLTPALEVLVISLLWRLGNGDEVVSLLRARHQWRKVFPESKEDVLGQEALAEMLIAIVTDDATFKHDGNHSDRISRLIIAYAIDLLNNIRSFQIAGKHLLALGRCGDAITITQKAIGTKRRQQNQQQQQSHCVPIKGAIAYDFFTAAINEAKALESVGDRCRLLFNCHSFILDYDPACMEMTPNNSSGELQSALASKFGKKFPSELFGGDDDASAISLKAMFGFSIAHFK